MFFVVARQGYDCTRSRFLRSTAVNMTRCFAEIQGCLSSFDGALSISHLLCHSSYLGVKWMIIEFNWCIGHH